MQKYLRTHPTQMLKSWYAFFFQLTGIPEWFVRVNNWQFLIRAMPDDFTEEQRDRYREAWAQPGAMTSMINWYRASLRGSRRSKMPSRIQVPTLVLWGQQDPYLSYEMAPLSVDLCEVGRLITFEDATHWVMHDKPGEVSQLLIEHFRGEGDHPTGTK
jgi:pimeloyl-ACP methyl ester carboxylesterase